MGALLLAGPCRGADPLDVWTQQQFGTNIHLTSIAFGGGQFVIAGHRYDSNRSGLVVTSVDGVNWTPGNSEITGSLRSVTYGKGHFVAVGDKGTTILSPDGTNWTKTISGTSNDLKSVAYGNDRFIAVGSRFTDSSVISRDGTNWTILNLDLPPYSRSFGYTIGFGAGQFILLWNALILTSTNGTNWTDRFSANGATTYLDVACGNGRFVAVGSQADIGGGGNVATSPDAITWSHVDIGDYVLYGVAFGSGRFVGVGGYNGMGGGFIVSSPDGVDWTWHAWNSPGWLEDVAYGNGRFVAVGDFNTILSTEPIIRLEPIAALANGNPQFSFNGPLGQSCRIQASTDFANWVTLTNMFCTDGVGQFVDPSATNFSQRFYQVVSP